MFTIAPLPRREHLPQFVLHAQKDALEVGIDDAIPVFLAAIGRGSQLALNSGVVHRAIELAEGPDGKGDKFLDFVSLGNVRPPRGRFGSRLFQLRAGPGASFFIEIRDHHLRARRREPQGNRAADTRSRAGHQGHLVSEVHAASFSDKRILGIQVARHYESRRIAAPGDLRLVEQFHRD